MPRKRNVDVIALEMFKSEEFKTHCEYLDSEKWPENFFDDKDWKSVFKSHPGYFACDIFFKSPTAELSRVEIAQEIQQRYEKSRPFMILGSFWGSLSRDLDRMVSEGILVMDGRTKKYSKKT